MFLFRKDKSYILFFCGEKNNKNTYNDRVIDKKNGLEILSDCDIVLFFIFKVFYWRESIQAEGGQREERGSYTSSQALTQGLIPPSCDHDLKHNQESDAQLTELPRCPNIVLFLIRHGQYKFCVNTVNVVSLRLLLLLLFSLCVENSDRIK